MNSGFGSYGEFHSGLAPIAKKSMMTSKGMPFVSGTFK